MNIDEILRLDQEELYDVFLFYVTMHFGESVELVAELEQTTRYEQDAIFRIYVLFSKILLYVFFYNKLDEAVERSEELIRFATSEKVWEIVSYCHYLIATSSFRVGLYDSAYEHSLKAIMIEERHGLNKIRPQALRSKATTLLRFTKAVNVEDLIDQTMKAFEETKLTDPRYATRKPLFLAMYFPLLVELNRLDEMKEILDEMRKDAEKGMPKPSLVFYYSIESQYAFCLEDYESSRYFFKKSLEEAETIISRFASIFSYCVMCVIKNIDMKYYFDYLMEGFEICKQINSPINGMFLDAVVTVAEENGMKELYEETLPLLAKAFRDEQREDYKDRIESMSIIESNIRRQYDFERVESSNMELKHVVADAIRSKNEVEEVNRRIKFVHELGRKLTTSLNLKEVVDLIYQNLKNNVPLTTFYIVMTDPKDRVLRSAVYYEQGELQPNIVISMDSKESMVARCYHEKRTIVINNFHDDKDYATHSFLRIGNDSTESAVFTPLIINDEVVAVCSIQYHEPDAYNLKYCAFLEELVPYLAIAVNNARKSAKLENEIRAHKQTQEHLISANARLEILSAVDGLTQISNRRDFETRVLVMLDESIRRNQPIGILMFDLDYFKSYNDTYGHIAGDEALKSVAAVIQRRLDEVNGLSARFGGEEFIAACSGLDEEQSEQLANQIREDLYQINLIHKGSPIGRLTVSVGVAILETVANISKSDLMRWADISLYQAKNTGKNKVVVKLVGEESMPQGFSSELVDRQKTIRLRDRYPTKRSE